METGTEEWHPGSFTKNFSWGTNRGLRELYEIIRIGFADELKDVTRQTFRDRVANSKRPDFIPINFFLFNEIKNGVDYLIVDELVFQAISFDHTSRFDHLALYAFILSMVGRWRGAENYQERPAMWAFHYVADRLGSRANWDSQVVSADDIQSFVDKDDRYKAKTSRKLATNLNFLLRTGGIEQFASKHADRWWVDAIFLTLDRLLETRRMQGREVDRTKLETYLAASKFSEISGKRSTEKDLALRHIVRLYQVCGERSRFDDETVAELTKIAFNDIQVWLSNSQEPMAALHPTNLRIVKTIPRACALLAQHAGFAVLDLDTLAETSLPELVRKNLEEALARIKDRGLRPNMTVAELMRLMRE
uniref:Uncharacterized protein n=1 Tax=Rhodopseudomonas palustris (strain DX-1) TaxID=652103 RepID=E6VQK2_RHOPX